MFKFNILQESILCVAGEERDIKEEKSLQDTYSTYREIFKDAQVIFSPWVSVTAFSETVAILMQLLMLA